MTDYNKEFRNLVLIKEVKDSFTSLVDRINDIIGKYNSSLAATSDIDFNYGSSDLSSKGYALSIGGLKKVLKAYEGKIFGCNMYRIGTTNNYVLTNGLYIAPSDREDGCPIPIALPSAILNNITRGTNQWVKYDFDSKTYSVVSRNKYTTNTSKTKSLLLATNSSNGTESPAIYVNSDGYLVIPANQLDDDGNVINDSNITIQDITANVNTSNLSYTQYIKTSTYTEQDKTVHITKYEKNSSGSTDYYQEGDTLSDGTGGISWDTWGSYGDIIIEASSAYSDFTIETTDTSTGVTYTGVGKITIPQSAISRSSTGIIICKGKSTTITKYDETFYVYLIDGKTVITTDSSSTGKNLGSLKVASDGSIYDLEPTGQIEPEPEPEPLSNDGLFPININRDIKASKTQPFQNGEISNLTINTGDNVWNDATWQDISVNKKGKFICFHPAKRGVTGSRGTVSIFGMENNRAEVRGERDTCYWLCTNYFFVPKNVAHPFTYETYNSGVVLSFAYDILSTWS